MSSGEPGPNISVLKGVHVVVVEDAANVARALNVKQHATWTPDRRPILMRWTAPARGIEVP